MKPIDGTQNSTPEISPTRPREPGRVTARRRLFPVDTISGSGGIPQRILFPGDAISGSGRTPRRRLVSDGKISRSGGNPPWKNGLAAIGVFILSWVFLKPLLGKLISFVKEKYGSN